MRAAACVAAVLLAPGCLAGGDDGPLPSPSPSLALPPLPLDVYRYSGTTCTEVGIFVDTRASNVRPYVPPQYQLVEANGRVTMVVAASKCASMDLGDNETGSALESDVGVFIEDPEGDPGPVFYQFWQIANRPTLSDQMARVGLKTGFAPESSLLTFSLTQTQIAQAHVPWNESEYRIEANAVPGPVPSVSQPFVWWHTSNDTTVRIEYTLSLRTEGAAYGTVYAETGTTLALLMGAAQVSGPGALQTFDLTAEARRIAP